MIDPTTSVANIDRLRSRFGDAWPSFHDAEIIAIELWRGDISPERESWVGPVITIKFHVLEATQPGATHSDDDTLVALRFHDCDDIKLNTFNHQNAINGLFSDEPLHNGISGQIRVECVQGFGVDVAFRCVRVEVLYAEPFSQSTQAI